VKPFNITRCISFTCTIFGRPVEISCVLGMTKGLPVLISGVQLGDDCVVEDQVHVGYDSRIGAGSRLMYGAYICDRVQIGAEARIAGFICDGTVVGERSTVMGQLLHEYTRPHEGWWDVDEPSPVIEHDVVVDYGATVVGGVHIGPFSYVAAGAIVTKDVPPRHVATGTNGQILIDNWTGRRLSSTAIMDFPHRLLREREPSLR
jgi:acetyltransferase-like isoleucine patch superfamily enzyme